MIARTTLVTLALVFLSSTALAGGVPPPKYQAMSVRDFIIDGPQLSRDAVLVQISGVYVPEGDVPMLYSDEQAALTARYETQAPRPPSIPLLTDDASRALREAIYSCAASLQGSCWLEVRGRATTCSLTNAFGASRTTPCVMVEDGGYPVSRPTRPPPPPPSSSPENAGQPGPQPDNDRILAAIRDAAFPCDAITSVQRGTFDYWRVMCGKNAYVVGDIGGGKLMVQRD